MESIRPDGTKTPFAPEVEERLALNEYYERIVEHYADRGEMTIGIGHDVLTLVDLDGRTFAKPLKVHAPIEDVRALMRAADDRESAWQATIDEIDRLATTIDTRTTMIALTPDGVVARELSAPTPRRRGDLGWTAYTPASGQTYPP